jgi:hypothetical protein
MPRFATAPAVQARTDPLLLARIPATATGVALPLCLLASVLCMAVGVIHIQDQGGFLGDVTPTWIAVGYYLIEITSAVAALLLARQHPLGWLLALGVSAGPAVAYLLSRSVGLPGDPGDVGNWGYTLGTVSLVVEGTLFLLCVYVLTRQPSTVRRAPATGAPSRDKGFAAPAKGVAAPSEGAIAWPDGR